MKFLRFFVYTLLVLGLIVVALGFFAKQDYHIERSISIQAPKTLVAGQVSCFKNFKNYSPWQELDPSMRVRISDKDCQVGSLYEWEGNENVGKGKMVIKSISPDRVDTDVTFMDDWYEATSPTFIKLEEKNGATQATWGMDMHVAFPWNGFSIFTDMDKAIGPDYEKGLAKLKAYCEDLAAHPKYNGYEVKTMDFPTRYYSGIRSVVAFADIAKFFVENTPKAAEFTAKGGGEIAGTATGIFWSYDETTGKSDCATTFPLKEAKKLGGGVQVFTVGGRQAHFVEYFGPYETTSEGHKAIDEYMAEKGLTFIPPSLEEYVTDPTTEPDTAKWLTRVVYFLEPKPAPMPEKK